VVKEFASVTSIDFSKTEPHDFAVTSSTRVWRPPLPAALMSPSCHYFGQAGTLSDLIQGCSIRLLLKLQVQIYSPHTNTVKKTFSRFKDLAYSGTFRDDGKLLLAGGENGIVQASILICLFPPFFFRPAN